MEELAERQGLSLSAGSRSGRGGPALLRNCSFAVTGKRNTARRGQIVFLVSALPEHKWVIFCERRGLLGQEPFLRLPPSRLSTHGVPTRCMPARLELHLEQAERTRIRK